MRLQWSLTSSIDSRRKKVSQKYNEVFSTSIGIFCTLRVEFLDVVQNRSHSAPSTIKLLCCHTKRSLCYTQSMLKIWMITWRRRRRKKMDEWYRKAEKIAKRLELLRSAWNEGNFKLPPGIKTKVSFALGKKEQQTTDYKLKREHKYFDGLFRACVIWSRIKWQSLIIKQCVNYDLSGASTTVKLNNSGVVCSTGGNNLPLL